MNHTLIGITGGSGSGKSTFSQHLLESIGNEHIDVISLDCYYKDFSDIDENEREGLNFDHPDAFDLELLKEHLCEISGGCVVEIPQYDYERHCRKEETREITPKPITVIEGIMLFESKDLRELFDIKVFLECPSDIRFIRRLRRDIRKRGRNLDSVIEQYLKTVRPMHLHFIQPMERYADVVIPYGGQNQEAIELLKAKIKAFL